MVVVELKIRVTRKTESRAARVSISEHETVLPHLLCTRLRRSFMILNASSRRLKFGGASCSPGPLADPTSNTDESQPYTYTYIYYKLLIKYIYFFRVSDSLLCFVYLNETIMEVKTKQAGSLTDILFEDFLELLSDNGFQVRADRIVEVPWKSRGDRLSCRNTKMGRK